MAPGGFLARNRWWLIPLLVFDLVIAVVWFTRDDAVESGEPEPAPEPAAVSGRSPVEARPVRPVGNVFGYPTRQEAILDTNAAGVYMPTASGRPESAMYGTVRMSKEGNVTLPSHHEGIDIAPMERDRRQVPLDRIYAPLDGEVAYANRVAGNSNYGRYIVLLHEDPVGRIFTLYAHLEEVAPSIRPGHRVKKGDDIGRMGHSDATGLHVSRAHLHFEVGMMLNRNFHAWYKKQKRKPDHGNYHGQNLIGINPLDVYRGQQEAGSFSMLEYLRGRTPAFSLVLKTSHQLDYFLRYSSLWSGDARGGAIVLSVSEGGVPLGARPATASESALLKGKKHAVVSVNEDVLGRNGLRLVVRRQGQWVVGKNGERWLEILTWR